MIDWKSLNYKRIGWITGVVVLAIVFVFTIIVWSKVGRIPNEKELSEIQHQTATEIYSKDSVLLGRYFVQNRSKIQYEEIPENFLNALIATEDARFFEHEGIDYRSLGRVVVKTILLQDRSSGGGSTLSQQLAKNLYPRSGNGVLDLAGSKIKEALVASRLEELYSKEELLTIYLNTVSFGEDIYGLKTAAMRYFNKPPIELEVQEAAILVGILKATTSYNPRLYPDRAISRRNVVLSQMENYGYLAEGESDSIASLPLELNYARHTNESGSAPHYKALVKPFLDSLLTTIEKPDGSAYNLQTDGLRVTLPINSKLQFYAAEAAKNHLQELQNLLDKHWQNRKPWDDNPGILDRAIASSKAYGKLKGSGLKHDKILDTMNLSRPMSIYTPSGAQDTVMTLVDSIKHHLMILQAGVLSMDPATGEVMAWVGGVDYNVFQYDHVTARRQVGSTFKPILYTAALENGTKPCDFFSNERKVYEDYDDWSPGNSNDKYEGFYSLKGALTNSVNTVSAQLIIDTGIDSVISMAHRLGINEELPEVPSLALGTANLPLLQMVNVYATLANGGKRVKPVFVLKVEDASGNVLWEHEPEPAKEVLSERSARLITNFMQSVVNNGTAASLRGTFGLRNEIAGKTGTTQSYADGWFIGFTPELVTGVWVGADNPGVHFRSSAYGQGARMALPIWANYMKAALADPGFNEWNMSHFPELEEQWRKEIECPLYKEDLTLFDRLFGVKDREKEKEKKSLGERIKGLFKKKKDDE